MKCTRYNRELLQRNNWGQQTYIALSWAWLIIFNLRQLIVLSFTSDSKTSSGVITKEEAMNNHNHYLSLFDFMRNQ